MVLFSLMIISCADHSSRKLTSPCLVTIIFPVNIQRLWKSFSLSLRKQARSGLIKGKFLRNNTWVSHFLKSELFPSPHLWCSRLTWWFSKNVSNANNPQVNSFKCRNVLAFLLSVMTPIFSVKQRHSIIKKKKKKGHPLH